MARGKQPPTGHVTVRATLRETKGLDRPPARAYLFDHRGALVESHPVGAEVRFSLADERRHRLVVGPDLPVTGRSHATLAADLAKARAVSRDITPGHGAASIELDVPPSVYICWWKTCIYVHGSVRKQTGPGSYAPICDGIVEIFQVDLGCTLDNLASFTDAPVWYSLLVDVLGGLERDVLQERIRLIPGLPDPPPELFHETRVLQPGTGQISRQSDTRGLSAPAAAPPPIGATTARNAAAQKSSIADVAGALRVLPQAARKDVVIANKAVLAPFLCWLIPDSAFCWQKLGEATLQSDGTFSAEICFWCPEDFPDLYFEVVQTVDGLAREISDPQIACSTYYDYDGTQDVVITVDDPVAVACNDPEPPPIDTGEYYVWPTAIGNQDLRGINGLEAPAGGPPQGRLGSVPWGGTLALQMEFDPRLRSDGIARYYRWSYKFDGDGGFTPVNAPVNHRYKTVTSPPLQIHLHTVNLGPHTVGTEHNLFDVPEPYPGDGWVNINDPWDRPFAYFDSTDNHLSPFTYSDALPRRSGMCTLMLELFDASGALVPCANNGVGGSFEFVLPDLAGTPDDYTSVLGPANITPSGQLVYRLLVDNNDTFASIDSVSASGNLADPCGILHYSDASDDVAISYHATHPNDYLTWALRVYRGSSGQVAATTGSASAVPGSPPMDPFTNAASTLLGGCTNAAFAVNLWTWASATDGYGTQTQYDRFTSLAFALLTP